jgi:non-homologous end joining protein Ku
LTSSAEYSDTFVEELGRLIDAKSKDNSLLVKSEPKQKVPLGLLDALKASMQVKKAKAG